MVGELGEGVEPPERRPQEGDPPGPGTPGQFQLPDGVGPGGRLAPPLAVPADERRRREGRANVEPPTVVDHQHLTVGRARGLDGGQRPLKPEPHRSPLPVVGADLDAPGTDVGLQPGEVMGEDGQVHGHVAVEVASGEIVGSVDEVVAVHLGGGPCRPKGQAGHRHQRVGHCAAVADDGIDLGEREQRLQKGPGPGVRRRRADGDRMRVTVQQHLHGVVGDDALGHHAQHCAG